MTRLHRTALTTSQKTQFAASALVRQGEHGSKRSLSEAYRVSRPTVYAASEAAREALESYFADEGCGANRVDVDEAQLRRAVVALRVVAPTPIRAIEQLLPLLYPETKLSSGKIQQWLIEAEQRGRGFNEQASLEGIDSAALDEMFSQGELVLAGVDLDSGYLFALSLSERRDGASWAAQLREGQSQGLSLKVVVKDAAAGIAAGVKAVYPQAEQRDDCFHALYEMNKVRRRLEHSAYATIHEEYAAEAQLGRIACIERARRDKQRRQWVWKRRCSALAIERLDTFESAMSEVRESIEVVSLDSGALVKGDEVQGRIESAAAKMAALGDSRTKKVAIYLRNRAAGLGLAVQALEPKLNALPYSPQARALGCVIWRLIGGVG